MLESKRSCSLHRAQTLEVQRRFYKQPLIWKDSFLRVLCKDGYSRLKDLNACIPTMRTRPSESSSFSKQIFSSLFGLQTIDARCRFVENIHFGGLRRSRFKTSFHGLKHPFIPLSREFTLHSQRCLRFSSISHEV